MRYPLPLIHALLLAAMLASLSACQKPAKVEKPDYNRPLPPGASALRMIYDPADWPDVTKPWAAKDQQLFAALDRSMGWYGVPSSSKHFPLGDVTHLRARASVYAFKTLLNESLNADTFKREMIENFNCYMSVGYDNRGSVLYTGYYTPIFKGSREPTAQFKYPLYKKPADLDIDPLTGKVLGRKLPSGAHTPYATRRQLETSGELKGNELVYVASRFDQYVIHVNGSARIETPTGEAIHVGYAGNNGHEYTGLGRTLLDEGVFEPERLTLPAIRAHFADKPDELERYINMNDRFVFFGEYDGRDWPSGSLGVKVAGMRTLATDKSVFPRGGVVLVDTHIPGSAGGQRPFHQFMLDQDTGGAIRAAGRGDIYMGIGALAERRAGGQFAEGRLYYFFLKHDKVLEWDKRLREDKSVAKGGVAQR